MNEAAEPARSSPARRRVRAGRAVASNVIQLHQRIMACHVELLARWLEAGRPMGLCDGTTCTPDRTAGVAGGFGSEYVLVWVRENIDPAYIIRPDRMGWTVIDAIRDHELGRTRSFAATLHMIRPVLKLGKVA